MRKMLNPGDKYWNVYMWVGDEWETYAEGDNSFSTKEKAFEFARKEYEITADFELTKDGEYFAEGSRGEIITISECVYEGFFVDCDN